jgi:hypothetical protein
MVFAALRAAPKADKNIFYGGIMIVLASDLVALGACHEQLKLFRKHYPRGWRPTRASIERARRLDLNVEWYARKVLPQSLIQEYDIGRMQLNDEYVAKRKPLMNDYKEICIALYRDCTTACRALGEYEEKCTALHRECAAKRDALLAAAFKAYAASARH